MAGAGIAGIAERREFACSRVNLRELRVTPHNAFRSLTMMDMARMARVITAQPLMPFLPDIGFRSEQG
jgi:hypothetical protein